MNDSIQHSRWVRATGAPCLLGAALAFGWSSGCSVLADGPIEDLGNTEGGLTAPEPDPIPGKDFLEQIDPGFEGRWVGYVEDPSRRGEDGQPARAVFASGSTDVTLDYRFEGEFKEPAATLVYGAGPAQAVERGISYPAGVNHYITSLLDRRSFTAPVVEGFEYQAAQPSAGVVGIDPGRFSLLQYQRYAAFEDWCGAQEAKPLGNDFFSCIAASGLAGGDPRIGEPCVLTQTDGSVEYMDCNYVAMCWSPLCSCAEGGCTFAESEPKVDVWLERNGDEITGTISGATLQSDQANWYAPMGTLHLYRVGD